jgi:hypothetical protein
VVAVAGGRQLKLDAIYHALTCVSYGKTRFCPFNVLITDAATAEGLVERHEASAA